MLTCKPARTVPEIIGEIFFLECKGARYPCRTIKANGRLLYQIKFRSSYLYVTKTVNQHGIFFWTSIPQDLTLRRLVADLGKQIEDHLIKTACATTTASK